MSSNLAVVNASPIITLTQSRSLNRAIADDELLPEDEDFHRRREPWDEQRTEMYKNR